MSTTDTETAADYYGPNVRRVRTTDADLLCQELIDGKWVTFHRTNEISNDYAYTETSEQCRKRATKYIGGH